MRFEDLDDARSRPELVDSAQRDLEWLGIDWDGQPLLQSKGIDYLMEAANELQRQGRAYPCVCSRSDIRSAQNAPHGPSGETRYPGTCRGRFASVFEAHAQTGRDPGLRFIVPPDTVRVADLFAGDFTFNPNEEGGDFLITRRDGSPAYQLAVVVDDLLAGVTEVVRGDDLLSSAARQMLLLDAFGKPHPSYYHVPLVCDAQGRRLAKRADDLSLSELRSRGVDPRTIVEWVALRSGFEKVERPHAAELLSTFSMSRVPKHPVRITPEDIAQLRR